MKSVIDLPDLHDVTPGKSSFAFVRHTFNPIVVDHEYAAWPNHAVGENGAKKQQNDPKEHQRPSRGVVWECLQYKAEYRSPTISTRMWWEVAQLHRTSKQHFQPR